MAFIIVPVLSHSTCGWQRRMPLKSQADRILARHRLPDEYMWHKLNILLQVAAWVAGSLALYLAAFMYEKGRARMRNKLEDWWVELRRSQRFAESPGSAFLQALSHLLVIRSIRIFMEEIFSTEWIIVSASFSLLCCLWMQLALEIPLRVGMGWSNPLILLRIAADKELQSTLLPAILLWPAAFAIAFILKFSLWLTGKLAATMWAAPHTLKNLFSRKGLEDLSVSVRKALPSSSFEVGLKGLVAACRAVLFFFVELLSFSVMFVGVLAAWLLGVPLSLAWLGGLAFFTLRVVAPGTFALSRVWLVFVPVAGVASAVLFLAAMQYIVLQKCWLGSWPFRKEMLALFSVLLLASFLFFGPLWFVSDGWALHTPTPAQMAARNTPSSIARYLAYSNGLDVVAAYGILAAALLLLAHTVVWPHVRRPIIAMRLAGIGFNSKVLCGFGVGFLLLATGRLGDIFNAFVEHPEMVKGMVKFLKDLLP